MSKTRKALGANASRRGCSGRQRIVVLFETRSLCGLSCARVFSVGQAGLELLSAGIKVMSHQTGPQRALEMGALITGVLKLRHLGERAQQYKSNHPGPCTT